MSLSDDYRDRVYRDVLGWPIPRKPETAAAILSDLRDMLADRRRRRELQHKTLAGTATTTTNEGTHHA